MADAASRVTEVLELRHQARGLLHRHNWLCLCVSLNVGREHSAVFKQSKFLILEYSDAQSRLKTLLSIPDNRLSSQNHILQAFNRCVGMALIPIAIVCMVANVLLLFPDMKYQYLTERHVTREATWCTGIWASGFLVLVAARGFTTHYEKKGCCYFTAEVLRKLGYTCLAFVAAGLCFVVSGMGLALGPLCLHNGTEGLKWERPLKQVKIGEKLYLYDSERWASACEEPRGVVIWNIVLFSVLMAASGLELIFCALHLLTALLEFMFGPGFCKNKVVPA